MKKKKNFWKNQNETEKLVELYDIYEKIKGNKEQYDNTIKEKKIIWNVKNQRR